MRKAFGSDYNYILGTTLKLNLRVDDTSTITSAKVSIYYYPEETYVITATDLTVVNDNILQYIFQTVSTWDRGEYVAVFTLVRDGYTVVEEILINLDSQTSDKI